MIHCKGTVCLATLLVVLAGVPYVKLAPEFTKFCPESCTCNKMNQEDGSLIDVQCGDRNLTSVPSASGKVILVSRLNLSFNSLEVLEQDALLGYQSAKYIYLQHCKLNNINEKTFWGLKNLTEVYLSNNLLTSIHENLFGNNYHLKKLTLRSNDLSTLQSNTPLLNGPSLTALDLQSCKLSYLSSVTFSLLPKLQVLDISRNDLVSLDLDALSSLQQLKDVNTDNNPWECGAKFEVLLCWMRSNLVDSHNRVVKCQHKNKTWETWTPESRSSLYGSVTTPSPTQSHKPDVYGSTTVNSPVPSPPGTETDSAQIWQITIGVLLAVIVILSLVIVYMCNRRQAQRPEAEPQPRQEDKKKLMANENE